MEVVYVVIRIAEYNRWWVGEDKAEAFFDSRKEANKYIKNKQNSKYKRVVQKVKKG